MKSMKLQLLTVCAAFSMLGAAVVFAQQTKSNDKEKHKEVATDLYTLDTCPVSGQKLGSMGDPVIKTYDGRELRFCCAGCVGRFEGNKEKYFKEIDKNLIKQQLPYYPMQTCVVMGDPLIEDGEDISVNEIYGNRLVRFCCRMCPKDFRKNPDKYLKKLDHAVIEQQRKHYPLDTCVVAGGKLGSMGEPYEIVVNNRLVRFCCAGCKPAFEKTPSEYLAKIDVAWKPHLDKLGKRKEKDADHGHKHDHSHDHDHHGHGHGHHDHDH